MEQSKVEIIKCFLSTPYGPVTIDSRTGGRGPLPLYKQQLLNTFSVTGIQKYLVLYTNSCSVEINNTA